METSLVLSECFSRWWLVGLGTTRGVVFMLILTVLLPYACSDDANIYSQESQYQLVNVSIIYTDKELQNKSFGFEGNYGKQSLTSEVSGVVMHAFSGGVFSDKTRTPNNFGCTNYINEKFPSENWIALVARGECSFANKIRIATKVHNASAIAIYNVNDSPGETKTIMDHKEALHSVAVLIFKENGEEIVKLIEQGYDVHMQLKPGRFSSLNNSVQNSISRTSVLFVSISFIVLMIVSLAWLVFYYIQRFRYSHAKEILARRLASAAKKAITKIPQRTVKMGDKELDSDYDQCAVCIEPYKFHEVIRILPCRHIFHKSCVDPWLLDQRTCPMCKMDILRAYGMQIGGSQESLHQDTDITTRMTIVTHEDPEISSTVEDNQADSVKVTLVAPTCLHLCHIREKPNNSELMSVDLHGAFGGVVHNSSSTNSLNYKSIILSRAEKSDKAESINSEMRALIGKGKDRKRRWKSEEIILDGDQDNDLKTVIMDNDNIAAKIEI